jgi:hypothetical protein
MHVEVVGWKLGPNGTTLAEMGLESTHTHSCPGCDPCPPADLFAKCLKGRDQ